MNEEVRKKYGWGVLKPRLRFDGHDVIAYDLIQNRYGVGMYLIKVLLFTLLAEQSFAARRCRLKAMEESRNDFSEHIRFMPDYEDALWADMRSVICSRDFALRDNLSNETYFYEEARNPFNDFLIEQAKSLGPDNDAIDPEEIHNLGNFDDLPSFNLFESYRKNLTGGSRKADYALSHGYVRISKIPKELSGEDEDVTTKRVKWLESKVPDEDWAEYEAERIRIAQLLNEVSNKGGKEDV